MSGDTNVEEQDWIRLATGGAARPRLLCLPYAGAGTGAFTRLSRALTGVELWAFRAPGRETRLKEPPLGDLDALVDLAAEELAALVDRPYVLFGYSVGGLVAFELARRLEAAGQAPRHLLVGTCRAPASPRRRAPMHPLPDREFVRAVTDLGGLPAELTFDADVLALFLPALRADLRLAETYERKPGARLACPVTVFSATDDTLVRPQEMMAWQLETNGPFRHETLDGGHFVIHDREDAVAALVRSALA